MGPPWGQLGHGALYIGVGVGCPLLIGYRKIVETLRSLGTDAPSRTALEDGYHLNFDSVKTVWTLQPGDLQWELAEPSQLAQLSVMVSPVLQEVYTKALRLHPCDAEHPWDLILGFDEFTPGDKTSSYNERKMMCAYFNFTNLGPHALSQGATWFVAAAVRTNFCKKVDGGWSAMLATFLRHLFLGPQGLSTAGLPLMLRGTPTLIYARLAILMSDGDGLRMAYCWRGASSIQCCLRHFNVLKKDFDLAGRTRGYCEITCDDPDAFQCASTQEFYDVVDLVAVAHARLQAGEITSAFHKQIVMSRGFNYVAGGMPYDMVLRANGVDVFQAARVDWMHSALQDGLLTVDCHLYVAACNEKLGKGYEA